MAKEKQFWLLKTEPSAYSIDDFAHDKKTLWTGVRNYQARNFIRDMKRGELFAFYHSGKEPAVVGVGIILADAKPDSTQFDRKDSHFDPKATRDKPIWYSVEVGFKKKLKEPVSLTEIKRNSILASMPVTQRGSRLSVQPALERHINYFLKQK